MKKIIKLFTATMVISLITNVTMSSCNDGTNRTNNKMSQNNKEANVSTHEHEMNNEQMNKKTDPTDRTFFMGKYEGHITYNDKSDGNESKIDVQDGKVEVVKAGDSYSFLFSNKIPNITNVMFEEKNTNYVISINSNESHFIKIDGNNLEIHYMKDNEVWTANCTR